MTEKASALSGNVVWVAGIAVALGVSVFALVATGVLDGSAPQENEVVATETAPAPAVTATPEPAPKTETTAEASAVEAPAKAPADAAAQPEKTAEAAPEPAAPAPVPPSFDLVRVDAEGNTVVAGAAAPNAELAILLDGVEIATSPADNAGKFAAVLTIEPSAAPRVLSLVERRDEGDVPSDATVIVAPVVAVAAPVAPAPAPAPAPAATTETETGTDVAAAAETETASTAADPSTEVAAAAPANTTETATTPAPAPAAKAPAVIVSDSEGVRVLQPAAPADTSAEVLAAVSIDSISYTDTGAVMVSGRGNAGQVVRLYLNNDLAAEAAIDATGMWSSQLSDVAGGLYEMRADEIDGTGKVLSRVLTPFKRETPETVAKARALADAAANTAAVAEPKPEETSTADTVVATAEGTFESAQSEAVTAVAESATEPAAAEINAEAAPKSAPQPVEKAETSPAPSAAPQTATAQADVTQTESAAPIVTTSVETPTTEAPVTETASLATPSSDTPVANTEAAPVEAAAPAAEPAVTEEATKPAVQIVTVQPGSTLWAIARDNYGEGLLYLRVFEANKEKILNPDLIYPGQVFSIPEQQ